MASSLLKFPEPAPSRGQYDRSLSRLERQQRQRNRLLFWAAREFHARGEGLTVAHVVEAAGTGRNTFYEYFDDLDNALDASGAWARVRLEQALSERIERARTPIARLKILCASWFEGVRGQPADYAILLWQRTGKTHDVLTHAVQLFARLIGVALGPANLGRRCQSAPHLDVAVAHAVAGLTAWNIAGGAEPSALEASAQAMLLEVFR